MNQTLHLAIRQVSNRTKHGLRKFVENCLDRVGMDYHKMRLEGRGVSEGSYSLGPMRPKENRTLRLAESPFHSSCRKQFPISFTRLPEKNQGAEGASEDYSSKHPTKRTCRQPWSCGAGNSQLIWPQCQCPTFENTWTVAEAAKCLKFVLVSMFPLTCKPLLSGFGSNVFTSSMLNLTRRT